MRMSTKAFAVSATLVLALAGCGAQPQQTNSQPAPEQTKTETTEAAPAEQSTPAPEPAPAPATTSNIQWTQAGAGDEAARAAGIDKFGVMSTIRLDETEFTNPAFANASGIVQATYTAGDKTLVVRKANEQNAGSVTDQPASSFAQTWNKKYEDLDVTMAGPAKGATKIATWKDGDFTYGITFQTASDSNTLDSEEVAVLVKALKEANINTPDANAKPEANTENKADDKGEQKTATTDTEAPADSGYISNAEAKNKVAETTGKEADETYAEYVDGHYFVTQWIDGQEVTYEVDAQTGEVWEHTSTYFDDGSSIHTTMTEDGALEVVENDTKGNSTVTSSTLVYSNKYGQTWLVTTTDSEGNVTAYYVDDAGNVYDTSIDY